VLIELEKSFLEDQGEARYFYSMNTTGVIEGFFGPQWPQADRLSYASFLSTYGGDFYIYAPKQDPYLRKKWREEWVETYREMLKNMVLHFHSHGIKFGVGFSPFSLGGTLTQEDEDHLRVKLSMMNELGIDLLGLFFDDMPTNENLANTQIQVLKLVKKHFHKKIIFCPSYYTPDPILDKVFGQRPSNYLVDIANGLSEDVSIAWTGPKVISPVIDEVHLQEVSHLLKRKPFIWENIFANDGPKNCKFLKLKPFTGRDDKTSQNVEAFGFNMMNQPQLSKILYLASIKVLKSQSPEIAFENALVELCSEGFKAFILDNKDKLLTIGLDVLTESEKDILVTQLTSFSDPGALEVIQWLKGDYNVGSECLTD
jgi:hyaluronoglucosaminidase